MTSIVHCIILSGNCNGSHVQKIAIHKNFVCPEVYYRNSMAKEKTCQLHNMFLCLIYLNRKGFMMRKIQLPSIASRVKSRASSNPEAFGYFLPWKNMIRFRLSKFLLSHFMAYQSLQVILTLGHLQRTEGVNMNFRNGFLCSFQNPQVCITYDCTRYLENIASFWGAC